MNEIGWLPAKNSPFGSPAETQKASDTKDKSETFAAFLAKSDQAQRDQAPQRANKRQAAPSTTRAPASIPQSAVTREGTNSQNTPTSGLAAQQASYSAAPQVSDTAVAFNARPIVGPASFSHTADKVFAPIEGVDSEQFAAARASLGSHLGIDDGHLFIKADQPSNLVSAISVSAPRAAPVPGTAIAAATAPKNARIDAPAPAQISGNSAKASTASSGRTASAAPVLPLQMTAAQSPAFAQLLASPSEYRLVIKGQRLSQDQREQVMRAVRSGLAEFGLPALPLAVFDQGSDERAAR